MASLRHGIETVLAARERPAGEMTGDATAAAPLTYTRSAVLNGCRTALRVGDTKGAKAVKEELDGIPGMDTVVIRPLRPRA